MNIFDLSWCRFYLHDKRYDIGFPLPGTALSMTFFIMLFIEDVFYFPYVLGLSKYIDLPFVFLVIEFVSFQTFFIIRHWNKPKREKRLSAYQEYKDKYPRKEKMRFLVFIITPILLLIIDFAILNIRHYLAHG